jgi:putative endopeptidase
MKIQHVFCAAVLVTSLIACAPVANDQTEYGNWGVDTRNLSETVRPGDDFFTYVNEGWLDVAVIPEGADGAGVFPDLYKRAADRATALVADSSALIAVEQGSAAQQVRDLYASHLNLEMLETSGLERARPYLTAALAISDHTEAANVSSRYGYTPIINAHVSLDPLDHDVVTLIIMQGGLGLGDREIYLANDEASRAQVADYQSYIAQMLTLAEIDDPEGRAASVITLETNMARAHWTPEQQAARIPSVEDRLSLADLEAFAPGFEWGALFDVHGLPVDRYYYLYQTTAIRDQALVFAGADLNAIGSYLAFHFLDNNAEYMPQAFRALARQYTPEIDLGEVSMEQRETQAQTLISETLSDQVGQMYVAEYFTEAHRDRANELVGYLKRTLQQRIGQLDWMSESTRAEALLKLEGNITQIGFPDVWHERADLIIDPHDLLGNMMRIGQSDRAEEYRVFDSVAQSDERWLVPPQQPAAFYTAPYNRMVFTASILEPPFFDAAADPAVNFGAIGAVIGHELGHGYDTYGAQYDGDGTLRNWWSEDSAEGFEAVTATLIEQYNQFSVLEGLMINGDLTLNENFGDVGGLALAHYAYRDYVDEHYEGQAPIIDGWSGDQRFFLGWAQSRRMIETDEFTRHRIAEDSHSPMQFQVNGSVRNLDAWYEAFGVQPGDALYLSPEARESVW